MLFATLKQYIFKSKTGKVIGGAYAIYLVVLMVGSAQIGLQLGTELTQVPHEQRMEYISTFLSNNF